MGIIHVVLAFLEALSAGRVPLAAENLALRRQLAVLQRSVKRPKLRKSSVGTSGQSAGQVRTTVPLVPDPVVRLVFPHFPALACGGIRPTGGEGSGGAAGG